MQEMIAMIKNICVGVCEIHEVLKICKGCYRSRLEIVKWNKGDDKVKQAIVEAAEFKRQTYGNLTKGN
jgi:predicted Fe-S protein YdhL (DUF1289 family)